MSFSLWLRAGALMALTALLACQGSMPAEGVSIRLQNDSPFFIDQIYLKPGEAGGQLYENIPAGGQTAYQAFPYTYRFAYVQAIIEEDTLRLQPTDYIGEPRYESGNYTYRLSITGNRQAEVLIMDFLED